MTEAIRLLDVVRPPESTVDWYESFVKRKRKANGIFQALTRNKDQKINRDT